MRKSFFLFCYILIVWSAFRVWVPLTNGWEEILFKPLIFLPPVYFLSVKKSLPQLLREIFPNKDVSKNLLLGLAVGSVIAAVKVFMDVSLRRYSFSLSDIGQTTIPFSLLVAFSTAYCEEIVFRWFMMREIFKTSNSFSLSLIGSTLFFVLIHIPRALIVLHFTNVEFIAYLWSLGFFGIMNGLLFWKTRHTATSIAQHSLWNFLTILKVI